MLFITKISCNKDIKTLYSLFLKNIKGKKPGAFLKEITLHLTFVP